MYKYQRVIALFCKGVLKMATTSFTKNIVLDKPEEVERFMDIWCDKNPKPPVDSKLADDSLKRGEELLKKYLSH